MLEIHNLYGLSFTYGKKKFETKVAREKNVVRI